MPKLWLDLLTPQSEGPPMWTFSSFQIPPRDAGPYLIPFFPHHTQLHGDLYCSFGCIAVLLPVSIENCSTCRYIFDVFMGGGELHVLLLRHFDPLSC